VWSEWINNGADLDDDMVAETRKTVQDAGTNAFTAGMSVTDWHDVAMRR
jgi:hypothetical protein